MENGKWKVGRKSGKWKVENGKWKMESGKWEVENGKWEVGRKGKVGSEKWEVGSGKERKSGKWEVRSGKWEVGKKRTASGVTASSSGLKLYGGRKRDEKSFSCPAASAGHRKDPANQRRAWPHWEEWEPPRGQHQSGQCLSFVQENPH